MISRRALENASGNDVRYSYCKVKGFCIIEILAPTRNFRNIVVLSLQQTVSFRAITPEKQCSDVRKHFILSHRSSYLTELHSIFEVLDNTIVVIVYVIIDGNYTEIYNILSRLSRRKIALAVLYHIK